MRDEFTIQKINLFTFSRHFVIEGQRAKKISVVASRLLGLHSARLSSAYVSLQARIDNFSTKNLRELVYLKRELIKIRCMRQTLHIVPINIAHTLHYATLKIRTAGCFRFYNQNNISPLIVDIIKNKIIDFVYSSPVDYKVLLDKVATFSEIHFASKELSRELARRVIKDLWEHGVICYINNSDHWAHEKRRFAYTETYYPEFLQIEENTKLEQSNLIYLYIQNFGPVTMSDMCWWSGLSKTEVKASLCYLNSKIKTIKVKESEVDFYMCVEMLEELHLFEENFCNDWIALLAYEDSTLKGYFESRFRYVNSKYYNWVFNSIGEILPTIVINGNVVGIWKWNKKGQRIETKIFEPISNYHQNRLQNKIKQMEEFLLEDNKQISLFN